MSRLVEIEDHHELRVITRDRDLGDHSPYLHMHPRTWIRVESALVGYLRPGLKDAWWLRTALKEWRPNVYYLNSLQSSWFTLLPLVAIKVGLLPPAEVTLAPRGETSPGARALKRRKKALWRPAIKWLIGSRVSWHLSSELEAEEALAWWGTPLPPGHTVVIRSARGPEPFKNVSEGGCEGTPVVTFASRIDPKKGLDDAIRLMARVDVRFQFDVYGTITNPEYWEACLRLAERELPLGAFRYKGAYEPSKIQGILSGSDLLLFPTHGENFGHVIAEALSVGCPVVVPPTTPWTALIQTGGGHLLRSQGDAIGYVGSILDADKEESGRTRAEVLRVYREWFTKELNPDTIFTT